MSSTNKTIVKPWGTYSVLEKKPGYWIKKLFVRRGASISLQSHRNRSEVWIVLSGTVAVVKGTSHLLLTEGKCIKIDKREKHRITGHTDTCILEVAFGKAREHDIVRFEDDYGRIQ